MYGRREGRCAWEERGKGEVCMEERGEGEGYMGGKRGGGGVHERKGVEKKRRQEVTQVHTQLWKEVKREDVHTT